MISKSLYILFWCSEFCVDHLRDTGSDSHLSIEWDYLKGIKASWVKPPSHLFKTDTLCVSMVYKLIWPHGGKEHLPGPAKEESPSSLERTGSRARDVQWAEPNFIELNPVCINGFLLFCNIRREANKLGSNNLWLKTIIKPCDVRVQGECHCFLNKMQYLNLFVILRQGTLWLIWSKPFGGKVFFLTVSSTSSAFSNVAFSATI